MKRFFDLVAKRASCREYLPTPVAPEAVDRILDAAMQAPSACNRQPWRLAVVTEPETRKRIVTDGFLPGLQMQWAEVAPVLLVLGIKKSFITHQIAPAIAGVEYPLLDLGIAGEHAVLQATDEGLGTCWIGWIQPKKIRRIVDWPRDITPQAVITIGHPARPIERQTARLSKEEIIKHC
jgi:nitroreductase